MKPGRKQRHYETSDGKTIVGLSRRPDGRWRIIGTQTTFREPDEARAIEKFHKLTEGRHDLPAFMRREELALEIQERQFWERVRLELQNHPKLAAEQTGIEELAYLKKLKPPHPSPTISELSDIFKNHSTVSRQERNRVVLAWKDFYETTGIKTLDDISADVVVAYRDNVHSRNLGGKTQSHLFGRIRRVISFAKSRAVSVNECIQVLGFLSLLKPNRGTVNLDPQPIELEDWRALLKTATGENRAMILLMLNCALYLQEVVDIRWEDIKGEYFVAHRKKTGQCVRVAVLWPETIQALNAIPKKSEHIFLSYLGLPLDVSGAGKRWRKLRTAAGISASVMPSHLRDGAYTAAVSAGVNYELSRLLTGHRTGMADNYVKRSPSMVKPATDAVYQHYMK